MIKRLFPKKYKALNLCKSFHLNRLKHSPRFIPGLIKLEGMKITYADSLALYHGYQDIFIHNIYHFKTKKSNPIILDLGGYIGLSVLYFKKIYPESSIHVFEPDPYLFNILKQNLAQNQIKNVFSHNSGAGINEGIKLFFPEKGGGGSMYGPSLSKKIEVNMIKLSNFINSPIDFIKINVEGMEYDILTEIEPKLFLVGEIVLEYHNFNFLPQTLGNILILLAHNGFDYIIKEIPSHRNLFSSDLEGNNKKYNLVYAKNRKIKRTD
jgi:FkbM family methyltransferase